MIAKFSGHANFDSAKFSGEANFIRAEFPGQRADFHSAKFFGEATFSLARFSGEMANFSLAEFSGKANFGTAEFSGLANFRSAKFSGEIAEFYGATFNELATFSSTVFTREANFTKADFEEEVKFIESIFPSPKTSANSPSNSASIELSSEDAEKNVIVDNKGSYVHIKDFQPTEQDFKDKPIPIKFDYSTFRKRVQFVGESEKEKPLQLGLVSFKGVDLSNAEFHNVEWQKTKEMIFITRNIIVDEKVFRENGNYEEVSKIYNQLRKNYESKLLFNEASNFFIGEMEAIRKSLLNGPARQKLSSVPYSLYKGLALYGESYFLPLIVWTPATILLFLLLRHYLGICSVDPHSHCSIMDRIVDSFASYFQFPRSATNTFDSIERIASIPILGTAFIAIRRKFERIK